MLNLLGNQLGNQLQSFLQNPNNQGMINQFLQNNASQLAPLMNGLNTAQPQQGNQIPNQNNNFTLEQQFLQSPEGQEALRRFQANFGNQNPLSVIEDKIKEYDNKLAEHANAYNAIQQKHDLLEKELADVKGRLVELESVLTNP